MTDKEVLKKAIDIAAEKGSVTAIEYKTRIEDHSNGDYIPRFVCKVCCFSHDFAEAFWGDGEKANSPILGEGYLLKESENISSIIKVPVWKAHLQQMVLMENPIDYLRRFIKDE